MDRPRGQHTRPFAFQRLRRECLVLISCGVQLQACVQANKGAIGFLSFLKSLNDCLPFLEAHYYLYQAVYSSSELHPLIRGRSRMAGGAENLASVAPPSMSIQGNSVFRVLQL